MRAPLWVEEEGLASLIRGPPPPPEVEAACDELLGAAKVGIGWMNPGAMWNLSGFQELMEEEGEGNHWPLYIATLCHLRLYPLR